MPREPTTANPAESGITIYDKIIDPIEAMEKLGKFIFESDMFGCKKPAQGNIIALACMCERKNPIEIARTYHIIQGKLSMRADAMLAALKGRGGKYKIVSRTDEKAEIEINYDGNKQTFSLSWEEAKKEPFVYAKDGKAFKDNWATPRGRMQMLWARITSDGVRAMAPEIVAGVYVPEEIEDFDSNSSPSRTKAEVEQRRGELQQADLSGADLSKMDVEADASPGSVIEADFEVAEKPQETEIAQSQQDEQQPDSQPEIQPASDPDATGKATIAQLNAMVSLAEKNGMSKQEFVDNLRKRGNVNTPSDLSINQAGKLIAGLEGQLKKKLS